MLKACSLHPLLPQTHRTQLAAGNPSGRCEWNFRCCFALELPTLYNDIKACAAAGCLVLCPSAGTAHAET